MVKSQKKCNSNFIMFGERTFIQLFATKKQNMSAKHIDAHSSSEVHNKLKISILTSPGHVLSVKSELNPEMDLQFEFSTFNSCKQMEGQMDG